MNPTLALSLWFLFVAYLLGKDSSFFGPSSRVLWVPLIWMMITGSRLVSQWLDLGSHTSGIDAYQEGNSVDRLVFSLLIILAVYILHKRRVTILGTIRSNLALSLLLIYSLVSFLWSDFPLVSLKRWIRDLGMYLMILVVVTESDPVPALKTVLRKFSYILISLSVILIKYFPDIGKGYSQWTGQAFFMGVTTTKNMLGNVCLVAGLYFVWDTLGRLRRRSWSNRTERQVLGINFLFLFLTFWLLNLADSATSTMTLILGLIIILLVNLPAVRRRRRNFTKYATAGIILAVVLQASFGLSGEGIKMAGRDSTLTGRTELWSDLLKVPINPLLGAGYESFWLGERLERIWQIHTWHPNQAHDGYLEVYLNLGWIGVFLLICFLLGSYSRACKRVTTNLEVGAVSIAFFFVLILYNVTEAAFKSHLVWFTFLLFSMTAPGANLLANDANTLENVD